MRIGLRIKMARLEHRVTQVELAHRADLSQAYLSQIETGERTPSDDLVEAIGQALGVDPSTWRQP
jgi:transcriptional regulator with XRE-family HTH domain